MTKTISVYFLLLYFTIGFSQTKYIEIDKVSKNIPDSLNMVDDISRYLTQNIESKHEKVRAIYIWISHNIKYDLKSKNKPLIYQDESELIVDVLSTRQGVCQHYSELFHSMCEVNDIVSYVISGYVRLPNGSIADLSHAWNGVVIDSKYYFIDVTWAAGYEQNNRYIYNFRDDYFLIEPQDFIETHMPFDPIWQFLSNPFSFIDFNNKNFVHSHFQNTYSYSDSIATFKSSDRLSQLEGANNRILASSITNQLIQEYVDQNKYHIATIKFNNAIDTLNFSIYAYNLYIEYKNQQFSRPEIADDQLIEIINDIETGIYEANKIFKSLGTDDPELNQLIIESRNRMPKLIADIEQEKAFIEEYISKAKPLRVFMFY